MSFRPPRPEPLTIAGPVGPLEAVLEDPAAAAPSGFAVVCHPHPLHGGTMHNKVVQTVARSLQELGLPTLRFNYRGVGASAGQFDDSVGETEDALAVVRFGRERWPGLPLTLGGFSFGALVALKASARAAPVRLISVAPAVARAGFEGLPRPDCPWLIVQGDADEIVDAREVAAFAARFTPPPQLTMLPGVSHFFHGQLPQLRAVVVAFAGAAPPDP